jgi:hypothetical protein
MRVAIEMPILIRPTLPAIQGITKLIRDVTKVTNSKLSSLGLAIGARLKMTSSKPIKWRRDLRLIPIAWR